MRVCLCDSNGWPQCANLSAIFVNGLRVYPGEAFTVSAIVVNLDFGTTVCIVHAKFLQSNHTEMDPTWHDQWVSEPKCSVLNYTVHSKHQHEVLLTFRSNTQQQFHGNISLISNSINSYYQRTCLNESLLTTPVFIDIVLLSCPPGFNLTDYPHHCDCYPILSANSFSCSFINKTGYITWNSTMWVNAIFTGNESNGIICNQFCPLDYCMSGKKTLNIAKEPDAQCDFNHAGRLHGGL